MCAPSFSLTRFASSRYCYLLKQVSNIATKNVLHRQPFALTYSKRNIETGSVCVLNVMNDASGLAQSHVLLH